MASNEMGMEPLPFVKTIRGAGGEDSDVVGVGLGHKVSLLRMDTHGWASVWLKVDLVRDHCPLFHPNG